MRVDDAEMMMAKRRYEAGAALRQIAGDFGLPRQRLALELRARGVRLRGCAPSEAEVDEMVRRYGAGDSWTGWALTSASQLAPFGPG